MALMPSFGVNLPNPSGIPVAGRTEGYLVVEAAELEGFDVPMSEAQPERAIHLKTKSLRTR
jgi:hypothetical protein